MTAAEELESLEGDLDRLRIASSGDVATALSELQALDSPRSRSAILGGWWVKYRNATSQLLRVIARDQEMAEQFASTLLACEVLPADHVDDVLALAFPALTGAFRDAAMDRSGVRERLRIDEQLALPKPEAGWLWPEGKPFPPGDTVEGVQARLNYLGLGAGPVTGEWTDLTQRAFVRWQVLTGLAPTGELDLESTERLTLVTPEAPD